MKKVTQFVIADPRTFDGDPYETAQRAMLQSAAVVEVLGQSLNAARLMLRNADLERQLALYDECDCERFEVGAHAHKFDQAAAQLKQIEATFRLLAQAAAYNPKAKIGR